MKRRIQFYIVGIFILLMSLTSCNDEPVTFPVIESPDLPLAEDASATLLWIGPDYKVAVAANLEDEGGITQIRLKNGEWQLDTVLSVDNKSSFVVNDTFLVAKDVNKTQHFIEMVITNSEGGVIKRNVEVEDLSGENQIEGYDADLLPPVIEVFKPEVSNFYGWDHKPLSLEVDASISDREITSLEVRVWGETAAGESFMQEDIITPETAEEKATYLYNHVFSLPGEVGEYQYIVKAVDAGGNKAVKGGNIIVKHIERLYLSDAENQNEVAHQGYDHYGVARGIGTLLSMKRKEGTDVFVTEIYYPNEATDNIRFVAFFSGDRPFNGATVNYTHDGDNVLALSASDPGKITADLANASFKLPVDQKGYYRITVDIIAQTINVTPFTPETDFSDPVKYPGWSDDNPWEYMAVTAPVVVGSNGSWSETDTSPKLMREEGNKYRFTGTFQTGGSSANISIMAPKDLLDGNQGWFRLIKPRAEMLDDYGDPITIVGAVGVSTGGVNYGFSTSPAGTYKATYDIALERLRLVRIGD